jgi:hypothetical protein
VVKGGVKAFFVIGGEVFTTAALRLTYEMTKETVEVKCPATKGYIPEFSTVTTLVQAGGTVVHYSKSEDKDKALIPLFTNFLVHQAGAFVGPYLAQKVTNIPIVTPFLGGVISEVFVQAATKTLKAIV